MVMVGQGCAIGWLSPALPLLQSIGSPLTSGPLTIEQTSWTGSVLSIGGGIGNVLTGFILSRIGAKHTLSLLVIPQLVKFQRIKTKKLRLLAVF